MEAPDWHVGLQQQHAYQHSDMMDIGTCHNILVQLLKSYSFWGITVGTKYYLWNLGLDDVRLLTFEREGNIY